MAPRDPTVWPLGGLGVHVLGEPEHLGVQALTHQAVPHSFQPPGQQQGCVLDDLQHLVVQDVTHQAALQSHQLPDYQQGGELGEGQHQGV